MLVFRFDVLEKLKDNGFSSYSLIKKCGFSTTTVQKLREGDTSVNAATLNRICELLHCQPGTLLKWIPDAEVAAPAGQTDQD